MMKTASVLSLIVLFSIGSLALFYYERESPSSAEEGESEEDPKELVLNDEQINQGGLQFASVGREEVYQYIPVQGRLVIRPDRHAHLIARSSGIVKSAEKNIGDRVSQDEILAIIESKELAEAKTNYLSALSTLKLQKTLLEKERQLETKGLGAGHELVQAENASRQAEIESNLAQQRLYLFGLTSQEINQLDEKPLDDFRLFEVRAPFEGIVLARDLTVGETVGEGDIIYEIANLDSVWAELAVYPKDAKKLQTAQEIALEDELGNHAQVQIERISPIIDERNGMIRVIANLNNSSKEFRPGTFVFGKLLVGKVVSDTCVPAEAVVEMDGQTYVFVNQGNKFEVRAVELGNRDEDHCHVISGVKKGERIVSKNATLLKCELTKQDPD